MSGLPVEVILTGILSIQRLTNSKLMSMIQQDKNTKINQNGPFLLFIMNDRESVVSSEKRLENRNDSLISHIPVEF